MIHLINDYYLDADNNCYIVGIPKKNKDEKTCISKPKYYSTLDRAISSTAERVLRDKIYSGEIDTLNSALAELQNIKNELSRVISITINEEQK
mgnify:CR=1 FL=1